LQPGSDNVIEAFAVGWMWRLPDKLSSRAINMGIGYIVDQNVQILGDGIRRNEPLPAGETDVRFRTTDQEGFLLMISLEIGD
jgi:hypothetical protein